MADLYKMASAEFLEQALSTDVDENAVNAIVGSLENQLVTSVSSVATQNNAVNVIPNQQNITSTASSIIGVQKYNPDQVSDGEVASANFQSSAISSSSSYNNIQLPFATQTSNTDSLKVIYSQAQALNSPVNRVTFPTHSQLTNGCIGLQSSQNQIIHAIPGSAILSQQGNKTMSMQPPLVIKQGNNTGQVSMQQGMVSVPMTVNSNMPGSIPNVMSINKPGGQNVVVTTQNLGAAQSPMLPNVQILNMRPGAPSVAAQKSVATVSPRVVIGTQQMVGARQAAPGITLQTLQSLQQGQQGHLLLKTENGQYQLLRVGPAPAASNMTAPQAQTLRLSTVPALPGVATVSTSVASPTAMGQIPTSSVPSPVVAASVATVPPPQPQMQPQPQPQPQPQQQLPPQPQPQPLQPTVTTQKPLDNTKEKCRNFLANLLDLSSKEPMSVETNVRNLIQELIDAQVEPETFCERLERLLNASPQPCLIGFLKKSLPLLRQSLVTKELVIEGILPPSPHVAFSPIPSPAQPVLAGTNIQIPMDEGSSSPTLTPLLPPAMPTTQPPPPLPSPKPINLLPVQASTPQDSPSYVEPPLRTYRGAKETQILAQPKPSPKAGGTIAVLQNIAVHPKIGVSKVGKTMTVNSKAGFSRPGTSSAALSTVLTPGKSLLKDKEKKTAMQFTQPFVDDKMAGDDDINDVAAMGGVNLAEETQRILGSTEMIGTQIRSVKDEYLTPVSAMQLRLKAISTQKELEEPAADVAALCTHAVHERLKTLVEKLAVIAQHRIDHVIKTDPRYEPTQDVKGQLKFLEDLDRIDKKRREDSEREMLMRAAKSRSKNEDPEQAKLKAKAKEMQRAEMEEARQREANLTALQAIGPRKKPRVDAPGGSGDAASTSAQAAGYAGRSQLALRSRLKRVNLRDMIFLLEQEKDTRRSLMLYKAYLK
ncbi:transcription initiation factor TFIID subunit 4-like isoform X2 [Epargyreus clarus]|uniref:transcription initiation factor TFIID subunit 4-like isoform X2 n=1 Tax=Epargyreus clarus TaxID=520877 RepID=UPI003C2CE0CE